MTIVKRKPSGRYATVAENSLARLGDTNAIIDVVNTLTGTTLVPQAIDCSGNPNYPVALTEQMWYVSVAGKIGGASGKIVEAGDVIICISSTGSAGGTEAAVGTEFTIVEKNITPSTVAILRTGTSDTDYVTPNVLADQLNAGTAVFSAANLMSLSGGTTGQLSLTTASAQNGLTVAGTSTGIGANITAAITTGIDISGATTEAINITGNSTRAINIDTGTIGTGITIGGTLTTGITIGACTTGYALTGTYTTGISLSGDGVTSINVTNGFSGTTMVLLEGTAANGISITGACTQGISVTGASTSGIYITGGTTQQASLAATAAQHGIYIAQSATTTGNALYTSTAINDADSTILNIISTMSTAFSTAKTAYQGYFRHTSNGSDVTGSTINGITASLSSTALSQISYNGFNVVLSGTYTAAAGTQVIAGYYMVPTITLNSATTTLYGVNVNISGVTRTSASAVYAGSFISASTATSAVLVSNSSNTIDICNGTTALTVTGTISKGIDFSTTTLTQGQENAFVHIGAWTTPKTISSQTEHYAPIQVNLSSNTSVNKNITAARFRVDTATANTLTNVYGIQIRNAIAHDVASFYGCHASANLSTMAVITGAVAVGSFYLEGTGTITPAGANPIDVVNATNVHSGTGVTNVLNVCNNTASAVTTVATFSNLSGAVTDMIYINNANTATNGILFAGTYTNVIDFGTTPVTTGSLIDYVGITTKTGGYLFNGSITTSTLTDSTLIDDFSCTCAHDGVGADTLRGKRFIWSGAMPNGTAASDFILQELQWNSTFGSGSNKGGSPTILSLYSSATINDSAANFYACSIDLSAMTLTSVANVYGVNITGKSGVDAAINISGANTTGIKISGTLGAVNSRAISATTTVNNGAYGDGYGLIESELTLTGTTTDHTAALSSWINIITGTATNYVCAQTNGVYEEATGNIAGATVIFGMRMQSLLAEAPSESYPFSCVSNTNVITAIFQCNDASSDLGRVTNAGVDNGTLVPLYKDNTGVKYVKIYTLAP